MSDFTWLEAPIPEQLSLSQAIAVHARVQLRRTLRLRTLWPWLALQLACVLGGWAIVKFSVESAEHFDQYVEKWGLNAIALMALGLGTAALKQDAEAGALSFFLLRPRALVALPIGRWLAVTAVTAAVGMLAMSALWLASLMSVSPLRLTDLVRMNTAALLAAAAYTASFLTIAVYFRQAIGVAVGWLVLLDGMAKVSEAFATLAPSHYLAAILGTEATPEISTLAAIGSLLVWCVVLLAATVVRLQRDPPISVPP